MAVYLPTSAIYGGLFGDAEIAACLSDDREVAAMTRFEAALARAEAHVGVIPADEGAKLAAALDGVRIDPASLADGVMAAGVPVPALVAALRQAVPADLGQWLHWGATSQDVIDTANVLMLKDCLDVIAGRLSAMIDALKAQSDRYADTVMAGRTRSQVAAPITFGLRCATWAQPLIGLEADLPSIRAKALRVQCGGAVGANTVIAPHGAAVTAAMADELGLTAAPAAHVDRSGLMAAAHWLNGLAQALAKMAGDLMVMGRSEIGEARAGAGGGSSTMPNKSNPVTAETVTALAHIAAAAHGGLMASATQAEERDGPSWAIEWALTPQLLIAAGAATRHGLALAETIEANPDAMRRTLDANDGVMAEAASFALAAHMPRADAQAMVKQAIARGPTLRDGLRAISETPVDWDLALDPSSAVTSCRQAAEAIFAQRVEYG